MNNISLFLDTADSKKTVVQLEKNGKVLDQRTEPRTSASQAALPLIDSLLKDQKLDFRDISEIRVNSGPGSFTGLRVGAAIANALGWLLHIPVNGKRNQPVEPVYENSKW